VNSPTAQPQAQPPQDQAMQHLQGQLQSLQQQTQADEAKQRQAVAQKQTKPSSVGRQPTTPAAQAIAQAGWKQVQDQQQQSVAVNRDKERKDQLIGVGAPEMVPLREVSMEFEAPPEVAPYVEVKPDPQATTIPSTN
jgi:hypothetical protein